MAKKTVDDIQVKGKRVLVRCDFNVPMKDGKITNDKRIVAALPTIKKLIADGGKGLVKVLVGDELGEVLGVHILGHSATELIAEAALAIEMEATAEEFIQTIHAHPTVSEALREAFLRLCCICSTVNCWRVLPMSLPITA